MTDIAYEKMRQKIFELLKTTAEQDMSSLSPEAALRAVLENWNKDVGKQKMENDMCMMSPFGTARDYRLAISRIEEPAPRAVNMILRSEALRSFQRYWTNSWQVYSEHMDGRSRHAEYYGGEPKLSDASYETLSGMRILGATRICEEYGHKERYELFSVLVEWNGKAKFLRMGQDYGRYISPGQTNGETYLLNEAKEELKRELGSDAEAAIELLSSFQFYRLQTQFETIVDTTEETVRLILGGKAS